MNFIAVRRFAKTHARARRNRLLCKHKISGSYYNNQQNYPAIRTFALKKFIFHYIRNNIIPTSCIHTTYF